MTEPVMKVSLISAYPGLNTGMLSVEYSFESICKCNPHWEVSRYCLETDFAVHQAQIGSLRYAKLTDRAQLSSSDRVVYWGDFLHWRGYLHQDLADRNNRNHSKIEDSELIDKYYASFFLEQQPELLERAVLYGGTLYPLNFMDFADVRYTKNLSNILQTARLARFRDAYSAEFARRISGEQKQFMGMDPGFLWDTADIAATEDHRYLAYSFGRSGQDEVLKDFAVKLARYLNLEPLYVDWFGFTGMSNEVVRKISAIKGAALVLTDIYHMGVNALREKKLTYMIGNGASYAFGTLSDKKKEVLFKQYFLEPFYLYVENIVNPLSHATLFKVIGSYLESVDQMQMAFTMIDAEINRQRSSVVKAINA